MEPNEFEDLQNRIRAELNTVTDNLPNYKYIERQAKELEVLRAVTVYDCNHRLTTEQRASLKRWYEKYNN